MNSVKFGMSMSNVKNTQVKKQPAFEAKVPTFQGQQQTVQQDTLVKSSPNLK